MSLGSRIRKLRKDKGLTQKDMGDALGMGSSNFGHIENDRVIPTSKDLDKIAEIFNTTTDYLLGREQTSAPVWATKKDIRDLKKLLESDTAIMFDGAPVSDDDKEKLKMLMEAMFWDAKKQNKRKPTQE